MIQMAEGFSIPVEVVTQTIGILATKRKGKSYTARRLVEQLHHEEQQVVIVDPKGDWWGVRSGADGKNPGLPIVIIGGERGDVPLEASGGELVAKLVVEERVSALLDLSLLRKHEIATFMTAFMEGLYRLKAREIYRTPLMLVIDEADAVAPQRPQPNEMRMLGAAEDIVRRGGQRGIGCTMISQRSAVLNKNVLSQIQVLVTLCTIAPQDLLALGAWIDVHGSAAQRQKLMESLPSLPRGDAWWWSPGWPTDAGIFIRTHTLPIETFDSGATPKPGEKRVEPRNVADVDLEALRRQMADTIERAKADDPKALRRQIVELERMLAAQGKVTEKLVEVLAIDPRLLELLDEAIKHADASFHSAQKAHSAITRALSHGLTLPKRSDWKRVTVGAVPGSSRALKMTPVTAKLVAGPARASDPSLPAGARAILSALASFHPTPLSRAQVGTMTGITPTGSTMRKYLGILRRDHIAGSEGALTLTVAGIAAAGDVEQPKTTAALVAMWGSKVPAGARAILGHLVESYPDGVPRDELAEACAMEPQGSTMRKYLGMLRSCGVVDRGEPLRASDTLFP